MGARQRLTSGRNICLVQKLRDAFGGQGQAAGMLGWHQRQIDSVPLPGWLSRRHTPKRNGYRHAVRQGRATFQDHHAVPHSTTDLHALMICSVQGGIKPRRTTLENGHERFR